MERVLRLHLIKRLASAAFLSVALFPSVAITAGAQVALTQISADPFTNSTSQHATEVEPNVVASGSTLVAAFQQGRFSGQDGHGGASDIGWATSTDSGATWTHGSLPGITGFEGNGPYDRVSDPVVAFDAAHNVWMIASLPISLTLPTPAVAVNRSLDGGLTWQDPVSVGPTAGNTSSDKNWITCDNTAASKFFGHCYIEWDDPFQGEEIFMSTSTDGGLTWGRATPTANTASGLGGQPLVQPNGTVVVPIVFAGMGAFISTDGGTSWSKAVTFANIQAAPDPGGIRSEALPAAAIDKVGDIVVVWQDCRFRAGCSSNDVVFSFSRDGVHWSTVGRVPIDPVTSAVDHFIPSIGIDPATSATHAHVAITYYFYPDVQCTSSTCQLFVGYISTHNGGATWNPPITLAGPMKLAWLPESMSGVMVGDYIGTTFDAHGIPHNVFAVAAANSGTKFNEAIFTAQGLTVAEDAPQLSSAGDRPLHKLSRRVENEQPEKGTPLSEKELKALRK